MSPSAYTRGHTQAIFYTLQYLVYLKEIRADVLNSYDAYVYEFSKARQIGSLDRAGVLYPKARVMNHSSQAIAEAPNVIGFDPFPKFVDFLLQRAGLVEDRSVVRAFCVIRLPVKFPAMTLEEKRILVTGATGFIGGHLARRLALDERARVTGTGRDLEKASHLDGSGVLLRKLEITDRAAVRELVQGQDIVFHLVVAPGTSTLDVAQQVNVSAAEDLVREAAAAGVSRFVHISSVAAYGPPNQPVIREDCPLDVEQSARYGRTKALGELAVQKAASDLGLELAIIRPGMVYGPRGWSWTVNLFKLVKKGVPVILGDGTGFAQLVYIDNLLDGMILAGTKPEAVGQSFNFVDEPLPWKELFAYYGAMCGRKPRRLPLWLFRGIAIFVLPFLGRTESIDDILTFYTSQSFYPTEKAEKLLEYQPRVSLDKGMRRTEEWLREAGYL